MKYIFSLLFFSVLYSISAQNLLTNGGHEDYLKKPSIISPNDSCYRELFPVGVVPPILNPPNPPGIASACGSVDHFCNFPYQGKAHGGFFVSPKFENPEYELCLALKAGYKYRVSTNLKLSKESSLATDQFGFWFTSWGYVSGDVQIKEIPDYTTPAKVFLDEKYQYTNFSFIYTAKGQETALVMGNFVNANNPSGSNTMKLGTGNQNNAYYHIDETYVVPVPQLPDSVIVCKGQQAIIAPENYQFCNGSLPVKWFYAEDPSTIISENDTLVLSVDSNNVIGAIVGDDTLFTQIIIKSVDFGNPLNESYDLCAGDSLKLDASVTGDQNVYLWNTGEKSAQISINQPGIYIVEVTKEDCSLEFETVVQLISPPEWNIEQDTFSICGNEMVTFTVNLNPEFKLVSSDGQVGNTFSYNTTGKFTFNLSPSCGNNFIDTVTIIDSSFDPEKMVLIPNVFTPNGDNRNDVFKIMADKPLQDFELSVYNRWGKKIFASTSQMLAWDGKVNGDPAPSEVYIYSMKCMVDDCGKAKKIERKGDVTLIR